MGTLLFQRCYDHLWEDARWSRGERIERKKFAISWISHTMPKLKSLAYALVAQLDRVVVFEAIGYRFDSYRVHHYISAQVVKLVDTHAWGACESNLVEVQILFWAPYIKERKNCMLHTVFLMRTIRAGGLYLFSRKPYYIQPSTYYSCSKQ